MALSDDGRRALLSERIDGGRPFTPGTYRITYVDLADPSSPRVAWERTMDANVTALAPDASAYAYDVGTVSRDGLRAAVLVRSDGSGETKFGFHSIGNSTTIRIAPGGRFVAVGNDASIVEDLARHPPAVFERARLRFVADGCLLSILSSGHLLVEDQRTPRFGVYAPQANLPRIATFAQAGAADWSCHFAAAGRGQRLLLRHANGTLYVLDMTDVLHPRMSNPMSLPRGSNAAGMDAKGRIYALLSTQGDYRLEIYDASRTAPPDVDWVALERAHAGAQQIHRDKSLPEYRRNWDAIRRFEEAGASAALTAPVTGVSNHTAAAILDDYAFLLAPARPPGDPDVRALLHRAIELDPSRRLAYLNLADVLRQSLPSEPGPRLALLAEARANYRQYLLRGGPPVQAMEALMKEQLYRRTDGDMCRVIADFSNAGRLGELIHTAAIGVPANDGRGLDIVFGTEGTAHVPAMYAWNAGDDSPVEDLPMPDADRLWGGDQLGLVMYRDAAHVLHYRDASHPVASVALSGEQACGFDTSTLERVGIDALEPELCAQLGRDRQPAALEFDGPVGMAPEEVVKIYGETGLTGSRNINVGNDDNPIVVGRFELSSGAGAGCEETFFDELDAGAAHFRTGPKRDLLMALQGADVHNRYPILPCGNQPRFFVYKGTVYFETKPAQWPAIDQWNSYHRVARVRGGQVEDVCHFSFKTMVKSGKPQPAGR